MQRLSFVPLSVHRVTGVQRAPPTVTLPFESSEVPEIVSSVPPTLPPTEGDTVAITGASYWNCWPAVKYWALTLTRIGRRAPADPDSSVQMLQRVKRTG